MNEIWRLVGSSKCFTINWDSSDDEALDVYSDNWFWSLQEFWPIFRSNITSHCLCFTCISMLLFSLVLIDSWTAMNCTITRKKYNLPQAAVASGSCCNEALNNAPWSSSWFACERNDECACIAAPSAPCKQTFSTGSIKLGLVNWLVLSVTMQLWLWATSKGRPANKFAHLKWYQKVYHIL